MTTDGAPTEQARHFLAGVAQACADLDPPDRERLLTGLDEHLAELNADGVDLVAELGDPATYAGELRAAAGLPTPTRVLETAPAGPPTGPSTGWPSPAAGGPPTLPAGSAAGVPTGGRRGGPALLAVVLVAAGGVLVVLVALFLLALLFVGRSSGGSPVPADGPPAVGTSVTVALPDVTGMPATQARRVLEASGLVVEQTTATPAPGGGAPGTVLEQDPLPGSDVPPGATVVLTVSP